jgi:pyruvate kinase
MDLAGPKLRTGRVAEADFLRLKGSVTLMPGEPFEPGVLGFPPDMIAALAPGDVLTLRDRRGKQRELVIDAITPDGRCHANCDRSAEITQETEFQLTATGKHRRKRKTRAALRMPPVDIRLFEGDYLLLDRHDRPGMPAQANGIPARISCGEPAVLDQLHSGAIVWIDDGKIGALVDRVDDDGAWLRITDTGPKGRHLRADKGLNFPDADLHLPALNAKDLRDLDFAARHADLIGLSFAQSCADLETLRDELAKRDAPHLPIVAKIETARGVDNLPDMLLSMVDRHPFGVMIARGDLMVEIGGERMAELQEEFLWVCEAAHVPVIWATQVLETLAHEGNLSRPELTDAAASARADCVMLNKGPYLLKALSVLTDIHTRMAGHQDKKNPQLRALSLASHLLADANAHIERQH